MLIIFPMMTGGNNPLFFFFFFNETAYRPNYMPMLQLAT